MKVHLIGIFIFISLLVQAEDFRRELPPQELLQTITREKFPYADAIIIIKEQSFQIRNTEIMYQGVELSGPSSIFTRILIVKVLTDAGVEKYGNFEFEYYEHFGDEIKCACEVKARVVKSNNDIWVLPRKEVKKIVSQTSSNGTTLFRKVLFKIPNLVPGDLVQIEYEYHQPFLFGASGLFYYSDEDVVLYSNLYITLPQESTLKYFSFPQETIGEPKIEQMSDDYGAGKTYFWQVKNCNAVPAEKYAATFSDRALLTAFVLCQEDMQSLDRCSWMYQGSDFYHSFLKKQTVRKSDLEGLGLPAALSDSLTLQMVDSLYTTLRKKFQLYEYNSLYAFDDDIKSALKVKKGDATDLAFIMYNILKQWKQQTYIVWIRDLREGLFEQTVPTSEWFDRCAVLVSIGNRERIYDFDYSIPNKYEVPWYLKGISIPIILDELGAFIKPAPLVNLSNLYKESHHLSIGADLNTKDQASLYYKGSAAQRFRYKTHAWGQDQIREEINNNLLPNSLKNSDSIVCNDFMNNSDIRLEAQGTSTCQPELIDEYLVLVLKNDLIPKFRKDIFSVIRYSNLLFDGPFTLQVQWAIDVPENYQFLQGPADRISTKAGRVDSRISCTADSQKVRIDVSIKFPSTMIEKTKMAELLSLLDDIMTQASTPVKFKKKGF
jgi:hypothetical protein